MTKFEFLRKALFANEREDVAFRSVDKLMRRPIVRVTLEDRGDKGQRIKLIRDKRHARLIDLDESHLERQAELLKDQTTALLNNNKWMSDATLMNCIDGVKSVHWIIDAIELYRRIVDSPDDEISEQRVRDVENRIVQYEKTLHVIRSFRHTHEKDFENYVLSDDGRVIKEERGDDFGARASRCWSRDAVAFDKGIKSKRIVFAQSRNGIGEEGYRFMGVYQMDGYGEKDENGAPNYTCWKKVADKIKIYTTWDELVSAERPR